MEPIVLTNKTVEPNDEIVFSYIGEKKILWEHVMNYLRTEKKDMVGEWKYYNDGKTWLFRGLKKDKVIFLGRHYSWHFQGYFLSFGQS